MKLTCRIIGIESGSTFTDGRKRIVLKVEEADPLCREIRLPMPDFPRDFSLDHVLVFLTPGDDGLDRSECPVCHRQKEGFAGELTCHCPEPENNRAEPDEAALD